MGCIYKYTVFNVNIQCGSLVVAGDLHQVGEVKNIVGHNTNSPIKSASWLRHVGCGLHGSSTRELQGDICQEEGGSTLSDTDLSKTPTSWQLSRLFWAPLLKSNLLSRFNKNSLWGDRFKTKTRTSWWTWDLFVCRKVLGRDSQEESSLDTSSSAWRSSGSLRKKCRPWLPLYGKNVSILSCLFLIFVWWLIGYTTLVCNIQVFCKIAKVGWADDTRLDHCWLVSKHSLIGFIGSCYKQGPLRRWFQNAPASNATQSLLTSFQKISSLVPFWSYKAASGS